MNRPRLLDAVRINLKTKRGDDDSFDGAAPATIKTRSFCRFISSYP
ncbi:hypothetical protein EJ110_NYTH07788 [Nymphaea thermarum]|nr:hypothetical protein EJ110_NYTH07788 [Nymphaea thermarum]